MISGQDQRGRSPHVGLFGPGGGVVQLELGVPEPASRKNTDTRRPTTMKNLAPLPPKLGEIPKARAMVRGSSGTFGRNGLLNDPAVAVPSAIGSSDVAAHVAPEHRASTPPKVKDSPKARPTSRGGSPGTLQPRDVPQAAAPPKIGESSKAATSSRSPAAAASSRSPAGSSRAMPPDERRTVARLRPLPSLERALASRPGSSQG